MILLYLTVVIKISCYVDLNGLILLKGDYYDAFDDSYHTPEGYKLKASITCMVG